MNSLKLSATAALLAIPSQLAFGQNAQAAAPLWVNPPSPSPATVAPRYQTPQYLTPNRSTIAAPRSTSPTRGTAPGRSTPVTNRRTAPAQTQVAARVAPPTVAPSPEWSGMAADEPICYMQTSSGRMLNLAKLCSNEIVATPSAAVYIPETTYKGAGYIQPRPPVQQSVRIVW